MAFLAVRLLRFKWTYLIVGVILVGFGVILYAGAHPSQPKEIDGTITSYIEYTRNGSYNRDELKIVGDPATYKLDKTLFHPTLPDAVFKDGKVSIWVDSGTTDVIAITLYDTNDENPTKYTTAHYDNPVSERSDQQTAGIVTGVIGAIFLAVFGLWLVLAGRRRPSAIAMGGGAGAMPMMVTGVPGAPGGPIGLSADGKWYWDSAAWRSVSPDGRYWWDGTAWQQVGGVATSAGAPPPVA